MYKLLLVAFLALVMQHLLQNCRIIEIPAFPAIFPSANFASTPCGWAAFFPRDANATISENCIAIEVEKLLM